VKIKRPGLGTPLSFSISSLFMFHSPYNEGEKNDLKKEEMEFYEEPMV